MFIKVYELEAGVFTYSLLRKQEQNKTKQKQNKTKQTQKLLPKFNVHESCVIRKDLNLFLANALCMVNRRPEIQSFLLVWCRI